MTIRTQFQNEVEKSQAEIILLKKDLREVKNSNVINQVTKKKRKGDAPIDNPSIKIDALQKQIKWRELLIHVWNLIFQAEENGLKTLDLSYMSLLEIPKGVFYLKELSALNLEGNYISTIPTDLFELTSLTHLNLGNNEIPTLPSEIKKLINLRTLTLKVNPLVSLPKEILYLSKLEVIDLSNCQFNEFPIEVIELAELTDLRLGNLETLSIATKGGKLPSQSLNNNIKVIPSNIKRMSSLRYLNLNQNNINGLPNEILELNNLYYLGLEENPLPIPPEILENGANPISILRYYFSIIEKKRKALNETKLLVVGQGSVGKTSLINRVVQNIFNNIISKTDGISIKQWQINDINLNIWDFGGQEIMHATHQFFLTKRSLYVLVIDSRLTQEENRVEYWLKIIQSFGGESPVLIVGNKVDQHPLDIDRKGLQKKYPNIVDILETSAVTGAGIEELKAAITAQVNNLPHVRDLLPETWFTVKTKLEELGKQSNFITQEKYLDLCGENEVSDETSQRTLIGFLHDLGVVLHFQDDPRLEALGILNPQWVTNGVYKILNSHTLFQNRGVLTVSMLDEILNLPEYPRGKRLFIVDMMKKFELCYDIEADKSFLVPDLLPKDQPDLRFNGLPAFEYAYPVLPSSVITRFIVRMNQKIDDGLVWRTGVVLKIGENKALVKADIEDRKITIAIDGLEHTRRDALSAIRYELGEIHNSIKGLNPQQRVPVPNAPLAEPLKYEYLLKLERAGQETVLVENGNDLVTVNVRQMLSAIETEAQRREQQGNIINNYYNASDGGIIVGRDLSGNLISGNNNKIIQDSYNKIQSADIDPELKQTLKSLTEAITTAIQSFPEEKTAKVAKNFERLADEVIQPEPDKQWYSVSIEGLIKAAENLDKLGTPVISLSRKVLSLLTGGVVK
jgi:internalin A